MTKKLLLVDYENKQQLDLSELDSSYSVIVFVGHHQLEHKIKKRIDGKNKFIRVDYQKIAGQGKNALDFYIAFTLGRVFETEPETECFILSSDKGFNPLIQHLHDNNFKCIKVENISDLITTKPSIKYGLNVEQPELTICMKCKKTSTIEHNGGRWCTNCGRFASPPNKKITDNLIEKPRKRAEHNNETNSLFCSICHYSICSGDGIFDDGEWTCWGCLKTN